MQDPFKKATSYNLAQPASDLFSITPSDSLTLIKGVKALRLYNPEATVGTVTVLLKSGDTMPIPVPPNGLVVETVRVTKVLATGTSSTIQIHGYSDTGHDNAGGALYALSLGKVRPVDCVMFGDSLQVHNSNGWDGGINEAFARHPSYGMWALPLMPQVGTVTSYAQQSRSSTAVVGAVGADSGADAAFDDFRLPVASYMYTAAGAIGNSNGVVGSAVSMECDVNGNVRFHTYYGTFDTGAGSFRPRARLEATPFTQITVSPDVTIPTNTGVKGEAHAFIDIAPAARNTNISFKYQLPSANPASVGPTIFFAGRIENLDRTHGLSCHSFYAESGQSMYDCAAYFQGLTIGRRTWGFGKLRELQISRGYKPIIVLRICFGFNDRNETSLPTRGPLALTSNADGGAAYGDNLRGLLDCIYDAWLAKGWDTEELYVEIVTPYPVTEDDEDLKPYRDAANEVAAENTHYSHVDYSTLVTYAEMVANGWLADAIHFNTVGTSVLCHREIALLP